MAVKALSGDCSWNEGASEVDTRVGVIELVQVYDIDLKRKMVERV